MEDRQDVTVPMEQSMVDQIAGELDYGDSRAEWIRDAIRMRLEQESKEADVKTDGGSVVCAN